MAFVIKCDICGEIYKSSTKPQSSQFGFDGHFVTDLENGDFDLCPKCTKKVLEFIDVLKSGNPYVIHQDDASLLKYGVKED